MTTHLKIDQKNSRVPNLKICRDFTRIFLEFCQNFNRSTRIGFKSSSNNSVSLYDKFIYNSIIKNNRQKNV